MIVAFTLASVVQILEIKKSMPWLIEVFPLVWTLKNKIEHVIFTLVISGFAFFID